MSAPIRVFVSLAPSRNCRPVYLAVVLSIGGVFCTGCLSRPGAGASGGRIDGLGLPRRTDGGTTTNRNTIYDRPASAPAIPPATNPSP